MKCFYLIFSYFILFCLKDVIKKKIKQPIAGGIELKKD